MIKSLWRSGSAGRPAGEMCKQNGGAIHSVPKDMARFFVVMPESVLDRKLFDRYFGQMSSCDEKNGLPTSENCSIPRYECAETFGRDSRPRFQESLRNIGLALIGIVSKQQWEERATITAVNEIHRRYLA